MVRVEWCRDVLRQITKMRKRHVQNQKRYTSTVGPKPDSVKVGVNVVQTGEGRASPVVVKKVGRQLQNVVCRWCAAVVGGVLWSGARVVQVGSVRGKRQVGGSV